MYIHLKGCAAILYCSIKHLMLSFNSSIAGYETGAKNPMDSVLLSICREFNVNEEWLRSGKGDMFKKTSDEIGYYGDDLLEYNGHGNPFYDIIIEMMKKYHELDDMSKTVMREYFGSVLNGFTNKKKED